MQPTLSKDVAEGLRLMYEEEKLAHDVYVTLYQKWQIRNFANISQTEIRHQQAIKQLLDNYQISYPELQAHGQFGNQELQKAYDELSEKGLQNEEQALRVGAYVEEMDIDDLIQLTTSELPDDIKATYEWLTMGSRNHLRAFCRAMTRRGIHYEPQILSQSDFEAIINSPKECGRGQNKGRGRGRGRNKI